MYRNELSSWLFYTCLVIEFYTFSGKIVRIYQMPYVPIGLWFRLISRMITLTANRAFQALLDIAEPAIRKCWLKGLYIFWSEVSINSDVVVKVLYSLIELLYLL